MFGTGHRCATKQEHKIAPHSIQIISLKVMLRMRSNIVFFFLLDIFLYRVQSVITHRNSKNAVATLPSPPTHTTNSFKEGGGCGFQVLITASRPPMSQGCVGVEGLPYARRGAESAIFTTVVWRGTSSLHLARHTSIKPRYGAAGEPPRAAACVGARRGGSCEGRVAEAVQGKAL